MRPSDAWERPRACTNVVGLPVFLRKHSQSIASHATFLMQPEEANVYPQPFRVVKGKNKVGTVEPVPNVVFMRVLVGPAESKHDDTELKHDPAERKHDASGTQTRCLSGPSFS